MAEGHDEVSDSQLRPWEGMIGKDLWSCKWGGTRIWERYLALYEMVGLNFPTAAVVI